MRFTRAWLLAAVAAIVAGAALTVPFRHLWEPDEARYAEVTREMMASGQLLVPFLFDETYAHKPPLYFWAQAAVRSMGASWTVAAVIPPMLAMLATLLLLPWAAELLGLGRPTGWLAAALLASSPLAAGMALFGRMDMILAFLHTAALLMLARLLGVIGAEAQPHRAVHLSFWVLLAAGVLTKGPVAIALPLLVAVTMMALQRRVYSLRPVLLGPGPLLFAALVLTWLVPAVLAGGPEYAADLLVRQTADRIAPSAFAHPEPLYFHIVTYPLTGLPWSPIVILALVDALRRRDRRGTLFLAVGVVSLVALFSLVSGKLVLYLLPMFPIAALLAADYLGRNERGSRVCLVVGSAGMVVLGLAVASSPLYRPEVAGGGALLAVLAGLSLALPGIVAAVLALRSRGATTASVAGLVAAGLSFVVVALPLTVQALDDRASAIRIASAIEELEPGRGEGFVYQEGYPGLWLYTGRRFVVLPTSARLADALNTGRWVLIREKHLRVLPQEVRTLVQETMPFPFRGRTLVLIRARQVDSSGLP